MHPVSWSSHITVRCTVTNVGVEIFRVYSYPIQQSMFLALKCEIHLQISKLDEYRTPTPLNQLPFCSIRLVYTDISVFLTTKIPITQRDQNGQM